MRPENCSGVDSVDTCSIDLQTTSRQNENRSASRIESVDQSIMSPPAHDESRSATCRVLAASCTLGQFVCTARQDCGGTRLYIDAAIKSAGNQNPVIASRRYECSCAK